MYNMSLGYTHYQPSNVNNNINNNVNIPQQQNNVNYNQNKRGR
jgi:hypothetical protein